MRLKKFVAAGLAAVLALSMAGCAPAVESCPAAEKNDAGNVCACYAGLPGDGAVPGRIGVLEKGRLV